MSAAVKHRSNRSALHISSDTKFKPNSRKRRTSPRAGSNLPPHSKRNELSRSVSKIHRHPEKSGTPSNAPPLKQRWSTFKADFLTELRSSALGKFKRNNGANPCAMRNWRHSKRNSKTIPKQNQSTSNREPSTVADSKPSKQTSPKPSTNHSKPPKPKPSKRSGKRVPELRAFVPRHVLEGGTAPPFRRNFWARVFNSFHPNTAIKVECLPGGLSASVLYAPECSRGQPPFIPTRFVSSSPRKSDSKLVYRDSPYEIRVAGMSVRNYDRWGPSGDNELLMYSVQTDPTTMAANGQSLPYIHFDFKRDGCARTEQPNTYVPIPASKSYVMGSSQNVVKKAQPKEGKKNAPKQSAALKKSVNVQFRILELDEPNEMVRSAVKGIDQLGGIIAGFSSVAPMLGVLSPALGAASSVSKHALDSYASPDKVISIDMDFLLADRSRVQRGTATSGEYLRYGYYFFLSEPVEGRLYASVKTAKNLQLMLRRLDGSGAGRRFFPLTDVSYLVVRVHEPTEAAKFNRRPILMNHATQLENIFHQSSFVDDPEQLRSAITRLGKELGIIPDEEETVEVAAKTKTV